MEKQSVAHVICVKRMTVAFSKAVLDAKEMCAMSIAKYIATIAVIDDCSYSIVYLKRQFILLFVLPVTFYVMTHFKR
jgi:hypothetical protein